MKPGDRVRLIDRAPIDAVALRISQQIGRHQHYPVVNVEVGELGTVRSSPGADGLFEVGFAHCVIVCNKAMVVLEGA